MTNFQTACGNCHDYILSKDWANAWLYYAAAQAQLAGLEVQAGSSGSYVRLHETLDGLKEALTAAQAAVGAADQGSRFITTSTKFQD